MTFLCSPRFLGLEEILGISVSEATQLGGSPAAACVRLNVYTASYTKQLPRLFVSPGYFETNVPVNWFPAAIPRIRFSDFWNPGRTLSSPPNLL